MSLDSLVDKLHRSIGHNQIALDYLHSRNVTDEEIDLFKIGYSRVVAFSGDGSEEDSIFVKDTFGGRKFENKVVLPILDISGHVAGLVGRGVEVKKFEMYLTLEAKFTGALFGLYQALPSIYETGRVFIVEGPFDLLAFRKVYPNVVSAVTAELTENQFSLLSFFSDQMITVFDSDGPGQRAVERAAQRWPLVEATRPQVRSINLGYHDPAKCLETLSLKKFKDHVERKVREVCII